MVKVTFQYWISDLYQDPVLLSFFGVHCNFTACSFLSLQYTRGVEIVNFLLVQGQVNGQNELDKENFTCLVVQISLYLSVLKQFTLWKSV